MYSMYRDEKNDDYGVGYMKQLGAATFRVWYVL